MSTNEYKSGLNWAYNIYLLKGDELFITSTDYDWRQLQFGKVTSANGKTVQYESKYMILNYLK